MISPCIKVCIITDNVCQGCKRTLQEIANWTKYTDKQRKQIMERLQNE